MDFDVAGYISWSDVYTYVFGVCSADPVLLSKVTSVYSGAGRGANLPHLSIMLDRYQYYSVASGKAFRCSLLCEAFGRDVEGVAEIIEIVRDIIDREDWGKLGGRDIISRVNCCDSGRLGGYGGDALKMSTSIDIFVRQ